MSVDDLLRLSYSFVCWLSYIVSMACQRLIHLACFTAGEEDAAEDDLLIYQITCLKKSYFLVGDDAFALRTWMMKPISKRNLSPEERVFNDRALEIREGI